MMRNTFFRKIALKANKNRRGLHALLLTCTMLLSLCSCAGLLPTRPGGSAQSGSSPTASASTDSSLSLEPVTVDREPGPQSLQTANAAAALALRHYITARLDTEAFLTVDLTLLPLEGLKIFIDNLVNEWETAYLLTTGAGEIADQALTVMESSYAEQTSAFKKLEVSLLIDAQETSKIQPVHLAASGGKQLDPKTWAENLTKQYDAIKGGQTIKQLAKQLGTDAKAAHAQLVLAQEIIHSGATADADFWDKLTKAAQMTKTACKVGLFVTSTVATGGGTFTALAGSSMTLAQAGATLVGGVDCIVDVAATGSNIILGQDHQVSVGFNDLKDKFAPVSAVVGLLTFEPSKFGSINDKTGEQIAYIGDSLYDWFYEGKIMGIKMEATEAGGTTASALPIDVSNMSEAELEAAIMKAGFLPPSQNSDDFTVAEKKLYDQFLISNDEAIAKLDALISQMAVIAQVAGQLEESDPSDAGASGGSPGEMDISGTYTGTETVTKAQNDAQGTSAEFTIRIRQDNVHTATIVADGGTELTGIYNQETGEFICETGGEVSFTINLMFTVVNGVMTAKGTMTSNQTSEGWTQESAWALTRIAD